MIKLNLMVGLTMSISSLHGWQVKHQNKLIVRQHAFRHSFEYSYATPGAIANDRFRINITLPTIKFNFIFKERLKFVPFTSPATSSTSVFNSLSS